MSGHTPGPFKVVRIKGFSCVAGPKWSAEDPYFHRLAEMLSWSGGKGGPTREEADATAHLFAASSLLLALLREAHQPVAEREYLASVEFYYGSGGAEPSPAEWGIHVGYQQTRDAMPHEQFLEEVKAFHRTNREEDDGNGEFLTLANRIEAAIAAAEGEPS